MEVQKALDKFGESVVKNSRKELTKKKKNASSRLLKSIRYKAKESKNSFELSFFMEDYGEFIDKGVKGVGGKKADGSTWKRKRVIGIKFKYTNKRPPAKVFDKWSIRRGLAPRSKGGQFTTRKSLQFALAESVYHTGLETTNFFTKPFESAFKKLPEEMTEAFALDAERLLETSLNNIGNS